MSDFRIYTNLSDSSDRYPFLLDIQTDLLSELQTTLVIPICSRSRLGPKLIKNLDPVIKVGSQEFVVLTQQMAAIPRKILGPMVEQASFSRVDVLASIDFLITGI